MRTFYILLFLFVQISSYGQADYSQNLWNSLVVQKKLSGSKQLTLDLGFRTYGHFVEKQRTALGRITFEKQFQSHFFGLGYAEFVHVKESGSRYNPEARPFVQYRFQKRLDKLTLGFRFRDEFRFFLKDKSFGNRTRFQVQTRLNLRNKYLNPVLNEELFYTFWEKNLLENRIQGGVISEWNELIQTFVFYTFQYQSSYSGAQHIIGLQLQFNLK